MEDLCTCGGHNGCMIHPRRVRGLTHATFALTAEFSTWEHVAQYFEEEAEGVDEPSQDKLDLAHQIRNKLKRVGAHHE